MNRSGLAASALALSLAALPARAGTSCTLLADSTGKVLFEEGRCDSATTPASTFKLPLALMGADAGYLKGTHVPRLAYRDSFAASLPSHRQATDPARWMTESVVWYSQEMTRWMGMERFRSYVERFGYGNQNLSGDRGAKNGLTNAWLSSSLAITPRAQIAFLAKVRVRSLDLAPRAYALLDSIVTRFHGPDGWTVAGKTGSGFPRDSSGAAMSGRSVGWFVGWLERDGRTPILFVRREIDLAPPGSYGGPNARQALLAGLPTWLAKVDSAGRR